MTETKITKNSYISIGVALLLVFTAGFVIRTDTRLNDHIRDPALHHNIVNKINNNYVSRQELDSRFLGIDRSLERIETNIDSIRLSIIDLINALNETN